MRRDRVRGTRYTQDITVGDSVLVGQDLDTLFTVEPEGFKWCAT